jgi:hypothetical protein
MWGQAALALAFTAGELAPLLLAWSLRRAG